MHLLLRHVILLWLMMLLRVLLVHDGRGFAEEEFEGLEFLDQRAVLSLKDGNSGFQQHLISTLLLATLSAQVWRG